MPRTTPERKKMDSNATSAASRVMPGERPGRRVLVVEDDTAVRTLLARGLGRAGFEVTTAENGQEAMPIAATQAFSAAVVDLMMPVVGGLQFLRWLRAEMHCQLPVIIFTGHDDDKTLSAAREAGANHVLIKPVGIDQLVSDLQSLIAGEKPA